MLLAAGLPERTPTHPPAKPRPPGLARAVSTLAGVTNAVVLAVPWVLHVPVVNPGQDWHGYG